MIEPKIAAHAHPWPLLLRGVATLLALAVVLQVLASILPSGDTLQALGRERLHGGHLSSLSLFVGAGALLSALGLSRQSVALVGGYAFGATGGVLATLAAVTLGAALASETARRLGRRRLERRFPRVIDSLDRRGRERVFARTLAIRLFPIGSNLAINVAAGLARVDRRAFLGASFLGFLPQTLVFAIAGDGVEGSSPVAIALAVALLGVSIVVGLGFGRAATR